MQIVRSGRCVRMGSSRIVYEEDTGRVDSSGWACVAFLLTNLLACMLLSLSNSSGDITPGAIFRPGTVEGSMIL